MKQRHAGAAGDSRSIAAARLPTWSASRRTAACTRAKCYRATRCIRKTRPCAACASCSRLMLLRAQSSSNPCGSARRSPRTHCSSARAPATLLLTSAGMRDALVIGYQERPDIFARAIRKRQPLYQRVVALSERIDAGGAVLQPLDDRRRCCERCTPRARPVSPPLRSPSCMAFVIPSTSGARRLARGSAALPKWSHRTRLHRCSGSSRVPRLRSSTPTFRPCC